MHAVETIAFARPTACRTLRDGRDEGMELPRDPRSQGWSEAGCWATLLESDVVDECANPHTSRARIACPEQLYEHIASTRWQRE